MLFWIKVAHLMLRTHVDGHLVGSRELVEWNQQNLQPCKRCKASTGHKRCIIDDSHPACKTCRNARASCDRKSAFLFDCTRTEFYDTKEEFSAIYESAAQGRKKRKNYNKPHENISFAFFDGHPLPVCESCMKLHRYPRATSASEQERPMSVYTPEGIERAREFEDINLQIAAIEEAVLSVRSRLDQMYNDSNGEEFRVPAIRELLQKLRYLRQAIDDPSLSIPLPTTSTDATE
ncbi:hypothetical protein B0H16DRAFT_1601499 [Mycena metata]|uniref:Zn(2)-C6 fungal-type domain-containing protein n=1 Tax=Mycena metata TaxID=1033252 RepID=A0AAD7HKI1_9AGAR|nr:hypothetical protein B0H16DRAFT_1601499 [Mycena metata]